MKNWQLANSKKKKKLSKGTKNSVNTIKDKSNLKIKRLKKTIRNNWKRQRRPML